MAKAAALVLVALAGCGHDAQTAAPPARRDAQVARDAQLVELVARPLGMADLDGYGWRKRAGKQAFHAARRAEDKDDWPTVVSQCQAALAADPGHLEAAWLLAVGLAKLGRLDEVVAPLQLAVAGDFGKWGNASLEHPALQAFLATPAGQAWQRRVEADRKTYLAALARSIVVEAAGDLYAYDPERPRWYRLTRTGGAVIGALAAARDIAYVARERTRRTAIGLVDLGAGKTTRPLPVDRCELLSCLGSCSPIELAHADRFWIQACVPPRWRALDADGKAADLPAKTRRPTGPWLEIREKTVRLHRLPIASVSADWDEQGLASAIRIGTSNRVVTVPGQIDGNTAAWSPDRAHVAFVAVQDDHCTPGAIGAIAFVADAATGKTVELARGKNGLALEWVADRKIAIASDHGVSILDLGGAETVISGATDLLEPRRKPKCSPEPVEPPLDDDVSDETLTP